MSQLIEGFENWSGGLPDYSPAPVFGTWGSNAATVTESTSHVTQGTKSALIEKTSSDFSSSVLYSPISLFLSAGRYQIDFYLENPGTGTTEFRLLFSGGVGNPSFSASSFTLNTQSTLTLDIADSGYFNVYIELPSGTPTGSKVYVDNFRYDPIVTIPTTKEFKLTKNTINVLLDTVTSIPSTSGFEISYGTITATTDIVVKMVDTVRFKLDFAAGVADWDSDDWEYPDWATTSTSQGFRAFVDTVVNVDTVKGFDLVFSPITVIGDNVISVPDTKDYALILASDINAYVATIVRPDTKQFKLNLPTNIEAYSEVYKEYVVMLDSPFQYEILGVNVGTVGGGGRMTVFVDDQIIASDLLFDSDKTNIPLSGIINRGQRLWVGLYMKNGYFRSFDATFALKRDQT